MKQKNCTHCQIEQPLTEFYRQARGYSAWCKTCHRQWSHEQVVNGYSRARHQRPMIKAKREAQSRELGMLAARRLTPIERVAQHAWQNAYSRAGRNGKSFSISRDWVDGAFSIFCATNHYELSAWSPWLPTLDRIDNSRGYDPDNLRVVWLIENYARNRFTDDDVIEFCRRKLGLQ